jgi:hypothetical protein
VDSMDSITDFRFLIPEVSSTGSRVQEQYFTTIALMTWHVGIQPSVDCSRDYWILTNLRMRFQLAWLPEELAKI